MHVFQFTQTHKEWTFFHIFFTVSVNTLIRMFKSFKNIHPVARVKRAIINRFSSLE